MVVKAETIFISAVPKDSDFVDVLINRRLYLGLTRDHVARRLGQKGPATLAKWEKRIIRPGFDSLIAWAEALKLEVYLRPKELIDGKGFRANRPT